MFGRHYMPTPDEARSGTAGLGGISVRSCVAASTSQSVMLSAAKYPKSSIESNSRPCRSAGHHGCHGEVRSRSRRNISARRDLAPDYRPEMYWGKRGGEWPRPLAQILWHFEESKRNEDACMTLHGDGSPLNGQVTLHQFDHRSLYST